MACSAPIACSLRRAALLELALLPTGGASILPIEIGFHLLIDDGLLQLLEQLLALFQRQAECFQRCIGTHHVGDLLQVFRAIVRDSDYLDAEVHGISFLSLRRAVFTARRSKAMGACSSRSRIRSRAAMNSASSVVDRGPPAENSSSRCATSSTSSRACSNSSKEHCPSMRVRYPQGPPQSSGGQSPAPAVQMGYVLPGSSGSTRSMRMSCCQ